MTRKKESCQPEICIMATSSPRRDQDAQNEHAEITPEGQLLLVRQTRLRRNRRVRERSALSAEALEELHRIAETAVNPCARTAAWALLMYLDGVLSPSMAWELGRSKTWFASTLRTVRRRGAGALLTARYRPFRIAGPLVPW